MIDLTLIGSPDVFGFTFNEISSKAPPPSFAVAVIFTSPAAMPLTTPCSLTVAILESLDVHVTSLLSASTGSASAVSCKISPTVSSVLSSSDFTVIVLTFKGARVTVNVISSEILLPSFASALIITVPVLCPVTRPFSSTLAISSWFDVQSTVFISAFAGEISAVSCKVPPTARDVASSSDFIVMLSTGFSTFKSKSSTACSNCSFAEVISFVWASALFKIVKAADNAAI